MWTLWICAAFRLTATVRVTKVIRKTSADTDIIDLSTLSIRSTWRWITWSNDFLDRRWYFSAFNEWVSSVSFWTAAYRTVIDDVTSGSGSTGVHAGIHTLVIGTAVYPLTFLVDDAFRSAAEVRVTKQMWWTSAHGAVILNIALSIATTRIL